MALNSDLVFRIIVSRAYLFILFEVGVPNLVCGCILGYPSVVCYHWVTVNLTTHLVSRICIKSGAYP